MLSGGGLWISIDRDDHRVFLGLKAPVQGFFRLENLASVFVGDLIK